MKRLLLAAGTTEGRRLAEELSNWPVEVAVLVATGYGEELLPRAAHVRRLTGRRNERELERLLRNWRPDLAVDATHPYAVEVTENLRRACETVGIPYLRLLREEDRLPEDVVVVESLEAAARFLDRQKGTVLLTTGSKELAGLAQFPALVQRLYARVLPLASSLERCRAAGLPASHVLALQGPFSEELERAILRHVGARWLVSKSSGAVGGFPEKLAAARACGVGMVVVTRPAQGEGLPYDELLTRLRERLQI